jgi:putative transposase
MNYIGGTARGLNGIQLEIGGYPTMFTFQSLKPTIKFSDFMRELKSSTSKWANEITNGRFEWQNGYGAFTVGESQIESARRYIQDQDAHHRGTSFEEKFKNIRRKSGIDFDDNFLWK